MSQAVSRPFGCVGLTRAALAEIKKRQKAKDQYRIRCERASTFLSGSRAFRIKQHTNITSSDIEGLKSLLKQNPSLATARSTTSHPALLQCLALEAVDVPNKIEMAKVLIDAGADINSALGAAACINNVEIPVCCLTVGQPSMAPVVGRRWRRPCTGITRES